MRIKEVIGMLSVVLLPLPVAMAGRPPSAIVENIQKGYVTYIKVEADPSAVLVSLTDKFTGLPLEQEGKVTNAVCSEVSRMSQKDAGPEDGVALCDLILTGTDNKIGVVMFNDDGQAVTRWEAWYLRSKKK